MAVSPAGRVRCPWCGEDPLYRAYHDEEWGVPSRDDRHLYELLVLEGAQAGLSWITVLRKREAYRRAFEGFDPAKVAAFGPERIEAMLQDPGLVRNRAKLASAVSNARGVLDLQREYGSFAAYLWSFVGGRQLRPVRRALAEVPAETPESRALSKDLKRRGFKFVGPTIMYAFMQAAGLVDDHIEGCWRRGAAARD